MSTSPQASGSGLNIGGGNNVNAPNPIPPHVVNNPTTVLLDGGYTLNDMITDTNGSIGYTEDKAALGTTRVEHFLQVPHGVTLPQQMTPGVAVTLTGEQSAAFIATNYEALRNTNIPEGEAVFLTLLRFNMVRNGFVATDLTSRCVYVDEYRMNVAHPAGAVVIPITRAMTNFVADYWENIVSTVAHVFRVRGHHFKPEYQDTYDRTWNSTVITVPSGMKMPSWERIATAGIHCFGVRALHEVREWAFQEDRLARGLTIRRDASCAGSAPVRTTAAALASMSQAKWWGLFYQRFQASIDAIMTQAETLEAEGTRAHINAKLYNWNERFVGINELEVTQVAPYVMGWLDTLESTEPITKQGAITKRASGGSAIRATFYQVLMNQARGDRQYQTVAEYLA